MPEGPEVTILSQYLLTKLKGRLIEKLEVLSGKYLTKTLVGINLLNGTNNFKIINIESHGKLIWMTLKNVNNNENIYLVSHLGLTGEWGFYEGNNDRIKITIGNSADKKKYSLYYNDSRNFGNIYIYKDKEDLSSKVELLAPDALKTNFSDEDFLQMVKKYTEKSNKKNRSIFVVLMNQTTKDGLLSGLGNYLTPEILYRAKISPFREIGSLNNNDIKNLSHSIKYTTKLSYYNNTTGYMTNFGSFIKTHKEKIDNGKYPEYHSETKLKENTFKFNVYRQKEDPLGNEVERDVTINNGRTVYWVSAIQK